MIVDSSAIIAVLNREQHWQQYDHALRKAADPQISAATYVELGVVVDNLRDPSLSRRLDRLLAAWRIQVVPLTVEQARLARAAYRDYGRGSGHPARLNLGDCFAYALAADPGQSLLFKGDDFMHTDIPQALESEG